MELTNIRYLASSTSFFYSGGSRYACRCRRVGKTVIAASAAGSSCAADTACSEPFEQQNVDFHSAVLDRPCVLEGETLLLPFCSLFCFLMFISLVLAEPYDESMIRSGMRNVLTKPRLLACFVWLSMMQEHLTLVKNQCGMNGSIIYEVDRPENAGLNRSIKILGKAKEGFSSVQKVSWADLIAVAGAEAVALCGGPEIPVRLGRLDSSTADPAGKLPEETLDATALKKLFSQKGFSTQEMVVLSGAHTIGGKGFGSPVVFDNSYFKVLLEKPQTSSSGMPAMVGLRTDWALTEDDECLRWIGIYAKDQAKFFDDFREAYIKLVNSGASWRTA
ncbi:hypothetical protein ACP70R_001182 [Stipagrostis hirtigluma subsp. patula]